MPTWQVLLLAETGCDTVEDRTETTERNNVNDNDKREAWEFCVDLLRYKHPGDVLMEEIHENCADHLDLPADDVIGFFYQALSTINPKEIPHD